MNKKELTAPCGLDCFNCPTYEGIITDEWKIKASEYLKIPPEDVPCKGCRDERGNCKFAPDNQCATWHCAQEKGVTFCHECADFPCKLLMPTLQGAQYPHNMKVYNLCRMKYAGIERWIEESVDIRVRYYEGRFEVGKGPVL